ncbi:AAA+ ATPase domain [Macleaya cordata]|uniref:AAA+ ATPase domain n=1 Tax=Macleaya cordata TaxID=56857 RepID=A0A200R491_MACCD|nr:AAA+ ATPase domain [Macleaya cordata]
MKVLQWPVLDTSDDVIDRGDEAASSSRTEDPSPWCKLISQNPQNPHIPIYQTLFTVSSHINSDLYLAEFSNSVFIYWMKLNQFAALEITGGEGKGSVQVNGVHLDDMNTPFCLNSGDEVTFITAAAGVNRSYIFQQLATGHKNTLERDSQTASTSSGFKEELHLGILDGRELETSFTNFPHYLSEIARNLLIGSAFIHLKCGPPSTNYTSEIPSMSPRILLSGPAGSELYQEDLVKALANHFGAKLLIFGNPMFKIGDRVQFVGQPSITENPILLDLRGPIDDGHWGKVILAFKDKLFSKIGIQFDKPIMGGSDLGGLCEAGYGFFCKVNQLCHERSSEDELIDSLFEVVHSEISRNTALIVFLKDDVKKFTLRNFSTFKEKLENFPTDNVVIIASHIQAKKLCNKDMDVSENENKQWLQLFPNNKVSVVFPEDNCLLVTAKAKVAREVLQSKIEQEVDNFRLEQNLNILSSVFSRCGFEYEGLETVCIKDQILTNESAEKVAVWALGHSLMQNLESGGVDDATPVLSRKSIEDGIGLLLHASKSKSPRSKKSLKDVATVDVYENLLLNNVISPGDLGVGFDEIGAEEHVKKMLKELTMLSLQRTELFSEGQLAKPCKGILLFGPPGTGKQMLAKAVASEVRSNFISFSMSSITAHKWSGDGELYVKAVFSLARKLAPSIIFVDEVDSMLHWKEGTGESVEMRKMKKDFMLCWDSLCAERVLVLASTSRPYDLEMAVIRRLPCRLMVDLPTEVNRKKILKVILAKQKNVSPDVDLDTVAKLTGGYSASDLERLCYTAAYRPLGEILQRDLHVAVGEGRPAPILYGSDDVRPLLMEDFRYSLQQVSASVPSAIVKEIQLWNELNGDGGSQTKSVPSYYF